jgi:hypothetical protein
MVKVSKAWIPSAFNGIQYNTCKNPKCEHYGLDPELHPKAYRITYGGKALPLLQCVKCGEVPPIKSNQGIDEEVKDEVQNYSAKYATEARKLQSMTA